MIEFQNAEVIINKSGLMADSASMATTSPLAPVYVVGRRGSIFESPAGNLTTNLNVSYTPEACFEPNLEIINKLRTVHNNHHIQPETGSVAGISGYFYLENYSLRASPNELCKANASFISFQPNSGNILLDRSNSVAYNDRNATGLMHSYSTIVNLADSDSPPILEFAYEFRATWTPTYSLGSGVYPTQVQLAGGSETLTFVRDIYSGIYFSGESSISALDLRTPLSTIKLTGLSYVNNIMDPPGYFYELDCSGAAVNNELIAAVNEIVRCKTVVTRYF